MDRTADEAPAGDPEPRGPIATPWGVFLRALARLNGVALLVLALMISVDVTFRWLSGRPIVGVFEFSEILMVTITFLAIAHVQFTGRQLSIDLLSGRARGRTAAGLRLLDAVAGLAFFGILTWTCALDWWEALRGGFLGRGILQIPTAIPLGLVLFGSALMVLTLLLLTGRSLRALIRGRPSGDR